MAAHIVIELNAPDSHGWFSLPSGVQNRLQSLLDKQDREGALSVEERREAEGLVQLAELLSFLKSHATWA